MPTHQEIILASIRNHKSEQLDNRVELAFRRELRAIQQQVQTANKRLAKAIKLTNRAKSNK